MRETLKKSVKMVMLTGTDPALAYELHREIKDVDKLELWQVVTEVTDELAQTNVIYWGGQK
jgi:hypothetical protein